MVPRRQVGPVPRWRGTLEDAARTDEGGQGGRRAGRHVTLIQAQDHVDGLLFQLTQVGGADIAATVSLVPRLACAVGHLQLVMDQQRERGVLYRERKRERCLNMTSI